MNATTPNDCDACVERLNRVLDGDETATAIAADPHLAVCAECRAKFTVAKMLGSYPAPLPALNTNFTEMVLARAVTARTSQRRKLAVYGSLLALAASVALAVGLIWPRPAGPQIVQVPPSEEKPTGVVKPLNEAREAFVSLGNKVADESLSPAVNLIFASAEKPKPVEPVSTPLADLPDAARAGFVPLVNAPRRAINCFIRDVGGAASSRAKTNS